MIFVDEARVFVQAGNGGQGCESYYQDKLTRYPIPDGGDGGRGGDVIFMAHRSVYTLIDLKYQQHYKAQDGGHASSKGKRGRDGKPLIIRVPMGTIIRDHATGLVIRDLAEDEQSVVVAKGAAGGTGNKKKKIPTLPGVGEQRTLDLELKILADVGLIGFPNAGKSTLISSISNVKSKIANYPFTTKAPVLGVVNYKDVNFVVADLPGIIEGAHQGRGLGDRFLRHAQRARILVHVIDMAGSEGRNPLDDYEKINHELEEYSGELADKPRIIVANKMDLPEAEANLKRFKSKHKKKKILAISAVEKQGLTELIKTIVKALC